MIINAMLESNDKIKDLIGRHNLIQQLNKDMKSLMGDFDKLYGRVFKNVVTEKVVLKQYDGKYSSSQYALNSSGFGKKDSWNKNTTSKDFEFLIRKMKNDRLIIEEFILGNVQEKKREQVTLFMQEIRNLQFENFRKSIDCNKTVKVFEYEQYNDRNVVWIGMGNDGLMSFERLFDVSYLNHNLTLNFIGQAYIFEQLYDELVKVSDMVISEISNRKEVLQFHYQEAFRKVGKYLVIEEI